MGLHVQEKLFEFNADFVPTPTLVDTYKQSSDGLTWEFKLRSGVSFSNGIPFNSFHARKSLERYLKRDSFGQLLAGFMTSLDNPDDSTIVMKFKEPTGAVLDGLARIAGYEPVMMPPQMYEVDPVVGAPTVIGTGPYKLTTYKQGDRVVLTKWAGYKPAAGPTSFNSGEKKAYFDEIHMLIVPDFGARLAALETGALDYLGSIPPDLRSRLESNPKLKVVVEKNAASRVGIWINHVKKPFSDVRVRQAVQMAVTSDQSLFAMMGSKDLYAVNGSLLVVGSRWGGIRAPGDELYYKAPRVDEAKKLVQEAGYAGITVNLLSPGGGGINETHGLVSKAILESVGFKVDYQVFDGATYSARRGDKTYVDTFLTIGGFTFGGLSPLLQTSIFKEKFWNQYQDESGRMTALLNDFAKADRKGQDRLIVDLTTQFYRDIPYVIIGDIYPVLAWRAELHGHENAQLFGQAVHFTSAWKEK